MLSVYVYIDTQPIKAPFSSAKPQECTGSEPQSEVVTRYIATA